MKGQLQAKYARFFEAKPTEELYDLQADPFEMNNLAGDPAHENILQMLREQLATHIRETGDLGFFPPAARRKDDLALFDWVRASAFPLNQLHALAEAASTGQAENATMLEPYLSSKYATLRYWAATGYGTIGSKGHQVAIPKALKALLLDPNPDVAGAAAAALCYLGQEERGMQALISLMDTDNWEAFSSLEALLKNGVGTKAIRPYLPELRLRAVSENTSSEVDTRHFAYRSILVECGINSPEDLYEHEAWRIGN